jgi:hypothetical protein
MLLTCLQGFTGCSSAGYHRLQAAAGQFAGLHILLDAGSCGLQPVEAVVLKWVWYGRVSGACRVLLAVKRDRRLAGCCRHVSRVVRLAAMQGAGACRTLLAVCRGLPLAGVLGVGTCRVLLAGCRLDACFLDSQPYCLLFLHSVLCCCCCCC